MLGADSRSWRVGHHKRMATAAMDNEDLWETVLFQRLKPWVFLVHFVLSTRACSVCGAQVSRTIQPHEEQADDTAQREAVEAPDSSGAEAATSRDFFANTALHCP